MNVVQMGDPFGGPLRPRSVTKAFSRRANHQFTLVVLIYKLRKYKISAMTALSQVVILKCLMY
ncbi:hypothetical protein, partial [uncultured Virgibacillus sp.]|uniref:hypothetical protein n=1 Tax=uncultured Virgibacillus sp. TaxID=417355 RepID=UPI002630907B